MLLGILGETTCERPNLQSFRLGVEVEKRHDLENSFVPGVRRRLAVIAP